MGAYIPPGWPAGVHPPGSDEFESTAVGWLLDVVPPDYRLHGVLRRYPVALATMARYHSKACVEGARQGYRTARTDLAGVLPPHAIDTVLAAYRKEGARLAATAQAVDLVERALRGEVFTPKMSPPPAVPTAEEAKTGGSRNGGAKAAERRATGVKAAEQKGAERQGAKAKGTVTQAADAETQAAEVKTAETQGAETQGAEAQGAEARAAEKKAARGKATASGQSRAGARRNSADRGRSDLART
jgi:hypothetical protein